MCRSTLRRPLLAVSPRSGRKIAGWRRPLFFGVCDLPKGLVGADGSSQAACKTARNRRVYPRESLAGRESLREIADSKERPSAPARRAARITARLKSRKAGEPALRYIFFPRHSIRGRTQFGPTLPPAPLESEPLIPKSLAPSPQSRPPFPRGHAMGHPMEDGQH